MLDDDRSEGGDARSVGRTKKKPLSSAKEQCRVKRRVKRHRFSSPFTSDEDTLMGDEPYINSHTTSRPHHPSRSRPTSSDLTGLEGDTCDHGKKEAVGKRSRMVVIYEQQSWAGEIVNERSMKHGRGRPHKQYLVRWKPSHCAGVGGRIEGAKGVERSALTLLHSFIYVKLLAGRCRNKLLHLHLII